MYSTQNIHSKYYKGELKLIINLEASCSPITNLILIISGVFISKIMLNSYGWF
jgi:hypothetical protein